VTVTKLDKKPEGPLKPGIYEFPDELAGRKWKCRLTVFTDADLLTKPFASKDKLAKMAASGLHWDYRPCDACIEDKKVVEIHFCNEACRGTK
jgi:hypothetical protein